MINRIIYTVNFFLLMSGIVLTLPHFSFSQTKKQVTLEDVWQRYTFYPKTVSGVNWTKDGQYYTSQNDKYIIKYDIKTAQEVDTLYGKTGEPANYIAPDSYQLSAKEDKILLANATESIYRRSSKAYFFVYDLKDKSIKAIAEGEKQQYATFSPDGNKVAFVRQNNLYVVDLTTMKETAITINGKFNHIIYGATDWVYEEEFGFAKAFFWSPDSKKIAFYKFDESQVREYNMQMWYQLYPRDYKFKYPKAGEDNSEVQIWVYNTESKASVQMDTGKEKDIYIARINWTQDANLLSMRRMNRLQNQLEILHADASTGKSKIILTEKSAAYVDVEFTDDLTYLKSGKQFLHSSERDGFKHFYLYDMQGKLIRQITKGNWEVDALIGIDEKSKVLYYTSREASPLEKHIYKIKLSGKSKLRLSSQAGYHSPNFSSDFKYYLDYFSAAKIPPQVTLNEGSTGKQLKVLENNAQLKNKIKSYDISYKEFFKFKTKDNTELNGWTIKPQRFDARKKYPLLMFVYGGPGSQEVKNQWDTFNFFWYQTLANQGYIIACIDNRGTGGRGKDFRQVTYAKLGKYETQDQIEGAKYLRNLDYVDKDRIGIWGWSYGGYLSSLCIMLGADIFEMAIAVAPVSNWRYYDTIYTERYLQRPQDNESGYDDYSPVTHVKKLKGNNYLLIHGTGDDNVHFQNAISLQSALISAGKQFESFFYPNRNHGIYGGNTRYHLYELMTNFIKRKL